MTQPNVIFLTIDTLRVDRLGCFGYQRPITPNIDRLAGRGVRFTQAITGGSWTQAAFPVMMTSTYASMYGGCLGKLAPERPSPVATLAANGYRTAAFSTSPLLSRAYGYDRGFHHFRDLTPDEKDPSLRQMRGGQRLLRTSLTHHLSGWVGKQSRPAKIYVTAEDLTTEACNWIGQNPEPFFAWVHYMDVHWPYHREDQLQSPADIAQAWRDLSHLHEVNWRGAPITGAQRDHYIRLYEEALVYTDRQVGRLLDYLEANDLNDKTVVVLVSDHGEEFMEHGRWGHWENNLYDEILRVPLIFRLPDHHGARAIPRQVRTLDIMPTILELCGCEPPDDMLGQSLRPLWTKEGSYTADISVSEMWRDHWHIIAVRTEQHKYIWDSKEPNAPQLYNLMADPTEQHNVADEQPETAVRLHAEVEKRLAAMERTKSATASTEPDLDDEVLSRLRGLGYVE